MEVWNEVIKGWPAYGGIFLLMFSSFVIGYSSAWSYQKKKYTDMLRSLSKPKEKPVAKKMSQPKATNVEKPVAAKTEDKKVQTAKRDEKDIEVIFTEIKPKIIEVVKETQKDLAPKPVAEKNEAEVQEQEAPRSKTESEVAGDARATYLNYTRKKPELNFDSIGTADADSKEDLTKINGIGPYIEQKLNKIGIYNYEQISNLEEQDIRVLTELIDFFPGRIERDDWVGQSKLLNRQKQRS